MYARVATFESDPAEVDDAIEMVRGEVESGETPEGLEGARMLMLVNRETGKGLGVTLFESEEATVAGWIRRRRLEQCRRDLLDRRPLRVVVSGWPYDRVD